MKIIGLTGPSGTGKSTVAQIATQLGYAVIDCDKVAAEVTNDKALLTKLESAFSGVVINGVLDRKGLASKAFATPEKTKLLNSIMLPVIVNTIDGRILEVEKSGADALLLDAPTLYESGEDKKCTAVIAVLADEEIRKARILARDNLTAEGLKSRLKAAKPDSFYLERAEHIIYNNGDLTTLKAKSTEILKLYKEC